MIDVATRLCDRYRIESTLPAAGPSRAYRGVDERLDRPVMVLVPDRRPDDMALSQLDHPSLLRVYDADEAEGELFVVVEEVEGMTLSERLELGGPMSSDEAATLGRTIGAGLDHAHRLGVAGFELTEETVVITNHGPTVVDLGNGSGPEEDVAALGHLLRAGLGLHEPGAWAPLLDDMTDPDPEQRPDVPAVLARLATVDTDELTETRPIAQPETSTRVLPADTKPRGRRRPLALILAGLAVVALLVLAVVLLASGGGDDPAPAEDRPASDRRIPPDVADALDQLERTVQP